MPSRPVLIGRGLVLQTLNQDNTQMLCSRPRIQKIHHNRTVAWMCAASAYEASGTPQELRRPWRKGNTRSHPEPGS